MGATVKIVTDNGEVNYEFDVAKDGDAFKKDIENYKKENNSSLKKIKMTIKKTKDVKSKPKARRKYGRYGW